jgi:Carboxypeptidase regulatory-like domain
MLIVIIHPGGSTTATTCIEVQIPKKPVSHICGRLIDPIGDPIAHAKIQILKDDVVVAEVESDEKGNFSFGDLKEGNYIFCPQAPGFYHFSFPISVRKPNRKCGRSLEVLLRPMGPCGCSATLKRSWATVSFTGSRPALWQSQSWLCSLFYRIGSPPRLPLL